MITINLNENSGITTGELSVFPSQTKITGLANVKTDGVNWYFSSVWKYGGAEDYATAKQIHFDNLPFGLDRSILNAQGQENYPTNDGGYTDFKKDVYRVCDRWRQVLIQEYPNLEGQIDITGI